MESSSACDDLYSVVLPAHQMTKDFRPDPSDKLYTFDDVQGIEEAKAEVQEIVEFLKYPERFQRLGARLPTGIYCISICVVFKFPRSAPSYQLVLHFNQVSTICTVYSIYIYILCKHLFGLT